MIKSTWVELSVGLAFDTKDGELDAFVREEPFVTAMSSKWVGNADRTGRIEPHATLLWCGKGREHEVVCSTLSDILKHRIEPLHGVCGTSGELVAMGRYCIALPLHVNDATRWQVHDVAKELYDRLDTTEGMVDPATRAWSPHITLFDLEPSTEKRDLALDHLRTMGRLDRMKGKTFHFQEQFTVVSKLVEGNTRRSHVLFGWDKGSMGKVVPVQETFSF